MEQPTFEIDFKGFKNFDTLPELRAFVETIGKDKVLEAQHCIYPDGIEFYTLHYITD